MTNDQKVRELQQTLMILSGLCKDSTYWGGRMRLLDLIEETVGEILELCREEEKTGEEVASVAVSVEKGVEKAFEGEKEELVPLQLCHECLLSKKAEEVETCTECGAIVCGDCREEHKCEKAKA